MPRVKKTETFKKIEELAKEVPEPISWLLPDPNDPSSYMHPVAGLTRIGAALGVGRTLRKLGVPKEVFRVEMQPVLKVIKETDPEVLRPLKDVVPAPGGIGGAYYSTQFGGPTIELGVPGAMVRTEPPTFRVLQHEITHLYHELKDLETFRRMRTSSGRHHFPFAPIVEGATGWTTWQRLKQLGLPTFPMFRYAHWDEPDWPDIELATKKALGGEAIYLGDPFERMLEYLRKQYKYYFE